MPPAARLIGSPDDPDARLRTKRDTSWNGSKVHLTETCAPDGPNLMTDVQTTPAPTADGAMLPIVHTALAACDLLPAEPFEASASPDADTLEPSQTQGIDPRGPVHRDSRWQAQSGQGFALACFTITWDAHHGRCPQGQTSRGWSSSHDTFGHAVMPIKVAKEQGGSWGERMTLT